MTIELPVNPNGSTCMASVTAKESAVYLRTFGNVIHLVDASGKQLGLQESVDVGVFAPGEIQRVSVTVAHQGFWHEGVAQNLSSQPAEGSTDPADVAFLDVTLQRMLPKIKHLKGFAQGQVQERSCVLDPLEEAIKAAAGLMRDEYERLAQVSMTVGGDVPLSPLYKRISAHLEALLAAQLKLVSSS